MHATPFAVLFLPVATVLANPDCADGLYMIVARGSGEPSYGWGGSWIKDTGVAGLVAEKIAAKIPDSTIIGVDYPAALWDPDYDVSEGAGVTAMFKMINEYHDSCPDSKMALMGYSQGAQIVSDILCGGIGGDFKQDPPLSRYIVEHSIIAAVLFGDPTHVANLPYDRGTSIKNGVFKRKGSAICTQYNDRMRSWCDTGDIFCDSGYDPTVHGLYVQKYNSSMMEFVMERWQSWTTSSATPTATDPDPNPDPPSSTTSQASTPTDDAASALNLHQWQLLPGDIAITPHDGWRYLREILLPNSNHPRIIAISSNMSSMSSIGVLSIGEMGLGIAQLLISHKYRVLTYAADRSDATQQRAQSAGVELCSSALDLVAKSDIVLSIVPPRDALTTAHRIRDGLESANRSSPLYFVDLNAVSPSASREIAQVFTDKTDLVFFIDGAIIGGPPRLVPSSSTQPESSGSAPVENEIPKQTWKRPHLVMSGPSFIPDSTLAEVLNTRHISDDIGAASGLKMCFAALSKGFTSIAIQSFTTANTLGVLPELRDMLTSVTPGTLETAERGLVSMPPKAYRWVHEMREIGRTMEEDGGFSSNLFNGVADVYETVAERSILGAEKPGDRKRGTTVEDVVGIMGQSLKVKTD